jgi:hypothetical protein
MQVNFQRLAQALRNIKEGDSLHLSCVAVETGADTLTVRVDHKDGSYHAETCTVRIDEDCCVTGPDPADANKSILIHGTPITVVDFLKTCARLDGRVLTFEVTDGHSESAPCMVIMRSSSGKGDSSSVTEVGYPDGSHFHVNAAHAGRRVRTRVPLGPAKGVFMAARYVYPTAKGMDITLEPDGFLRVSTVTAYGKVDQYVAPAQVNDLFEPLAKASLAPKPKRAKLKLKIVARK